MAAEKTPRTTDELLAKVSCAIYVAFALKCVAYMYN